MIHPQLQVPAVVSREDWLQQRKELLREEKEFLKQLEKINTKRRQGKTQRSRRGQTGKLVAPA